VSQHSECPEDDTDLPKREDNEKQPVLPAYYTDLIHPKSQKMPTVIIADKANRINLQIWQLKSLLYN